jgi:hypothetical protein
MNSKRKVSMLESLVGLYSHEHSCLPWQEGLASAPETVLHEVQDIAAARNEENLHEEVIQRDPAEGEVQIAGNEDKDIEGLCFEGYATT